MCGRRRVGGWMLPATLLIAVAGCNRGDTGEKPEPEAYAASGGVGQTPEPLSTDQVIAAQRGADQTPNEEAENAAADTPPDTNVANETEASGAGNTSSDPFSRMMPPESARGVATPFTLEGTQQSEPKTATLTELRADLNPKQLLEFLSAADRDMQLIVTGRSGIEDSQQARKTLLHIVKMKLEASRRLAAHPDADDKSQSEGARGELQSLSHLAALGDVKAAEELETLAKSHLDAEDPQLVSDSRLVLIGFAIESLQNGDEEAPQRILGYIDQIGASATPPDVAAMMVMGQAREALDRYGYDQESRTVRDRIIELFADSPQPEIAEMAARMAGNVRFDGIDHLINQVIEGEQVDAEQWTEAAKSLIEESPDLQTVQYLAGATVEFEARGQSELVRATYDLLASSFTEPSSALTQEVAMAMEAYQARQDVIGQVFSPDLDSVDGDELDLTDYRGKIVLMPFWAMNFPPSLQVLPKLKQIAQQYPDRVAIVGVNLDAEGEPVAEFVDVNQLGFPSFHAPSSPSESMANQVAAKFGIVSLPYTAIVDKDGRVAAIDFLGLDLQGKVERMLQ